MNFLNCTENIKLALESNIISQNLYIPGRPEVVLKQGVLPEEYWARQ